jgi:hypothetical protein
LKEGEVVFVATTKGEKELRGCEDDEKKYFENGV